MLMQSYSSVRLILFSLAPLIILALGPPAGTSPCEPPAPPGRLHRAANAGQVQSLSGRFRYTIFVSLTYTLKLINIQAYYHYHGEAKGQGTAPPTRRTGRQTSYKATKSRTSSNRTRRKELIRSCLLETQTTKRKLFWLIAVWAR